MPSWLVRPFAGNRVFTTIQTSALAEEVQFWGDKALHKPAMKRFICTGDLAAYLKPVAEHPTAIEVAELVDAGSAYKSTAHYAGRRHALEKGQVQKFHGRHIRSLGDLDDYFEYQVRLIESVRVHGCLSRRHMSETHRSCVPDFSRTRPPEHDIGCVIGPAGETWMFRTGHHRLHIARALGIEEIPIEVQFVHWEWLTAKFFGFLSRSPDLTPDRR